MSKKNIPEPAITKELLDYMDYIFPNKCPDVTDTERKIWVDVGKREAFNHFQYLYKKQQDNILK